MWVKHTDHSPRSMYDIQIYYLGVGKPFIHPLVPLAKLHTGKTARWHLFLDHTAVFHGCAACVVSVFVHVDDHIIFMLMQISCERNEQAVYYHEVKEQDTFDHFWSSLFASCDTHVGNH